MKILLVQYYTDNVKYGKLSEELNRMYCEKNGYDYYSETDSTSIKTFCQKDNLAIQWYKVKLLKDIIETKKEYDWVLFMDADAVVSNIDRRVEEYIDDRYNLIFASDLGYHSVINTGVILVKNSQWSIDFLGKWWESRKDTTGAKAMEVLEWSGGNHAPENPEVFKSALWHEQTCFSILYKTDSDVKYYTKIIEKEDFNSPLYRPDGFIFHAFGYGHSLYRDLDVIHEAKTYVKEDKKKIVVVYFVYCIGDYLTLAEDDFNRIINSGLYDECSNLFVVCSTPDFSGDEQYNQLSRIYEGRDKVTIEKRFGNRYEHYGIVRAWVEAHKSDGHLLYFHAKGVSASYGTNEHSEWKRQGDQSFKEMLKYFMIDKYKDYIGKLEKYDQLNVSDSYSRGWPSGNFWWCRMDYLRKSNFPYESVWDRWASEAWINFRSKKYSVFQVYDRFFFRDKFTYLPEASYKNPRSLTDKKIILDYAKMITLMEPENENDRNRPNSDHAVDFTEFVQSNLEHNDYKGFSNIQVSFNTLGRTIEDPLFGTLKVLVIAFHVEGDDTQYRLVGDEGAILNYRIDSYSSIGYDFKYPEKTIREIIHND